MTLRRNKGLVSALLILSAWAALWTHLLGYRHAAPVAPGELLWIPLFAFVYTGLFITAHDSMHQSLAPRNPRLNRALGALCVGIFALFSYEKLLRNHRLHHLDPVSPTDPDFTDSRLGWVGWFLAFFAHYVSIPQFIALSLLSQGLHSLLGMPWDRVVAFQVLPPVLATFQLFHFGTFLPHRKSGGPTEDRHRARSNAYPEWLSFLSCYHFGYHHEHHLMPQLAWYELPRARRERLGERP